MPQALPKYLKFISISQELESKIQLDILLTTSTGALSFILNLTDPINLYIFFIKNALLRHKEYIINE